MPQADQEPISVGGHCARTTVRHFSVGPLPDDRQYDWPLHWWPQGQPRWKDYSVGGRKGNRDRRTLYCKHIVGGRKGNTAEGPFRMRGYDITPQRIFRSHNTISQRPSPHRFLWNPRAARRASRSSNNENQRDRSDLDLRANTMRSVIWLNNSGTDSCSNNSSKRFSSLVIPR